MKLRNPSSSKRFAFIAAVTAIGGAASPLLWAQSYPEDPTPTSSPGTAPSPSSSPAASPGLASDTIRIAILAGSEEVPARQSAGSGASVVEIEENGQRVAFSLYFSNLENVTAAHIHVGGRGVAGPIIFPLEPLGAGEAISPLNGTLTASNFQARPELGINTFDDAINAIRSGNAYVNVHTQANPDGEIRGQLVPVGSIPNSGGSSG